VLHWQAIFTQCPACQTLQPLTLLEQPLAADAIKEINLKIAAPETRAISTSERIY